MPLRIGTGLPSLEGATEWVNGEIQAEQLAGKPVLLHFWAISCQICKEKLPELQQLVAPHRSSGLEVIAVHIPLNESDLDAPRAKELAAQLGIEEPLALDHEHQIKERFEVGFVPMYFLFDSEHKMRGRAGGKNGPSLIRTPFERLFQVS